MKITIEIEMKANSETEEMKIPLAEALQEIAEEIETGFTEGGGISSPYRWKVDYET